MQRVVHKVGAIVNRHDLDITRKSRAVEFVNCLVNTFQHLAWIFSPPHEDDAFNTACVLTNAEDACWRRRSQLHRTDIFDV